MLEEAYVYIQMTSIWYFKISETLTDMFHETYALIVKSSQVYSVHYFVQYQYYAYSYVYNNMKQINFAKKTLSKRIYTYVYVSESQTIYLYIRFH